MFKDKKSIWVLEYVLGLGLLVFITPSIARPHPGWSAAHDWAYLLFIACSSIVLISVASATRQRMKLEERIAKLERMVENQGVQKQQQSEVEQKHTASEQLVSSVN